MRWASAGLSERVLPAWWYSPLCAKGALYLCTPGSTSYCCSASTFRTGYSPVVGGCIRPVEKRARQLLAAAGGTSCNWCPMKG
jgi:hypothetical protein